MSLKNILEELKAKELDRVAEPDPESPTYRMVLGNKIRAQEDIAQLRALYQENLRERMLMVIATGSMKDELAKMASEEYGMTILSAEALANETLSKVIVKEYVKRDFSPTTFRVLRDALSQTMVENRLDNSLDLLYNSSTHSVHVENETDLRDVLIQTILNDLTAVPFVMKTLGDAANQAMKDDFDGHVYPVLVLADNEILANEIFRSVESQHVVVGEGSKTSQQSYNMAKVDEESVKKFMNKLKSQAKQRSKA